jgi:hypothetical protein
MAYFSALRQSIGHLMSPAASNTKRPSNPAHSSSSSLKKRLDRVRMSPTKRTDEWLKGHSPEKKAKTPNVLGVKGSKITKKYLASPSSATKSVKLQGKFWSHFLPSILSQSPVKKAEDNFEGDTLVEGGDDDVKDKHSGHANLDGDTVLEPEDQQRDFAKISPKHDVPNSNSPANDDMKFWSKDEVWLLEKLNLRNLEPLMEATWHIDFPSFPVVLFSFDSRQVFINAANGRDFYARKALFDFMAIGADARDRITRSCEPEPSIHRNLAAYKKWALQDANLLHTPHIPLLAICSAVPHESVVSVVGRLTDQMHDFGRQYRELFRGKNKKGQDVYKHKLPTFFGIMVKYSIVAFFTWDSSKEKAPVRTLGIFDLRQRGQDVWHVLAFSILMVKVRNNLLALRKKGWISKEQVEESDPDA